MAGKKSSGALEKAEARGRGESEAKRNPPAVFEFRIEDIKAIRILLGSQGVVVPLPPRPRFITFEIELK